MITTVAAFAIFLTNPAGLATPTQQEPTPYYAPGESESREYASQDECMGALRDAKASQGPVLAQVATVDKASYLTLKNRFDSMQCRSVTRQIETNAVHSEERPELVTQAQAPAMVPASQGAAVQRYRIGRYDDQRAFHGTDYNPAYYATTGACLGAYEKTKALVMTHAYQQGADTFGASAVVDQFNSKYHCYALNVDPSDPGLRTPEPDFSQQVTPPQPVPQPVQQQYVAQAPQPVYVQQAYAQPVVVAAPQPVQPTSSWSDFRISIGGRNGSVSLGGGSATGYPAPTPVIVQQVPVEPVVMYGVPPGGFYMAEYVYGPRGPRWVPFGRWYPTPAACWDEVSRRYPQYGGYNRHVNCTHH